MEATQTGVESPRPGRRPGWLAEAAWLAPLLLLALGLRIYQLGAVRLLDDEMVMLNLVSHDLSYIFQACLLSPFLPVWHLLNFFWQPLASSDAGLRAFALAWGMAALLCTYGMVREAAGRRAALVAVALMAVNGFHIYQSQAATPYAFITALGAASCWALQVLLRSGGRAAAVTHTLLLGLVFYTHQTAIVLWGAQLAGVLLVAYGGYREHLRRVLTCHAVALLLGAGAFFILGHQWKVYQNIHLGYVPPVGPRRLMEFIVQLMAYRSSIFWLVPVAVVALVMVGAAALAAWKTVTRRQAPLDAPGQPPRLAPNISLLAAAAMLPLAACTVAALVLTKDFLYAPRFFALFVPAGIGLFAAATCWMVRSRPGRAPALLAGLVLLVALASQVGSLKYLYGGGRQHESFPIDRIASLMATEGHRGDVAVVHHSAHLLYFKRYYDKPWPRMVGAVQQGIEMKPFGGTHDSATEYSVRDVLERVAGYGRAWLVLTVATNAQFRDPRGLVEQALDDRFLLLTEKSVGFSEVDPVQVKLYALPDEYDPDRPPPE